MIEIKNKAFIDLHEFFLPGEYPSLRDAEIVVKNLLTIPNPLYNKKTALGLSVWGVPQNLPFYEKDAEKVIIPTGALNLVLNALVGIKPSLSFLHSFLDLRSEASDTEYFKDIQFNGSLRGYQEEIIKATENKTVGTIQADTGAGKTVTFVYLTAKKKVNTIVLVDRVELLNQIRGEFAQFTNLKLEDIGTIGKGKISIKPVTVALHQTLANFSEAEWSSIEQYFGQVIADEAHTVAANTYYSNLTRFWAKYKWGFTATPKRGDGLTDLIFWGTGPIIHETAGNAEMLENLIIPEYEWVETNYDYPLVDTSQFIEMVNDLCSDKNRQAFIVEEALKRKERPSVFLCGRVEQIEDLKTRLEAEGVKAGMLHSKMKKKDREEVLEKLNSGELTHVVSSWGLFSTGINVPALEVLYICSPMKSFIKIKQARGRIMRKSKSTGKNSALIVDFLDKNVWLLYNQWKDRKKLLMSK